MPRVAANGIELEYDESGEGPPLVLIMGIGAQMILWPDDFVAELASAGFRVIRFDNRDVGKSSWLDHLGVPSLTRMTARAMMGVRVQAPYTLWDMAQDTVGLFDALELDRAHVVGASMGGMVAQCLAIRHRDRLRSMTSFMSTTGDRRLFRPNPRAVSALLGKRPATKEGVQEYFLHFTKVMSGTGWALDEAAVKERAALAFDRGHHPEGFMRQWAAILAGGNRTRELRGVTTPSLVIHGSQDPLLHPDGGRATARAIPGARLELVEGLGHSLPRGAWPLVLEPIIKHCRAADAA